MTTFVQAYKVIDLGLSEYRVSKPLWSPKFTLVSAFIAALVRCFLFTVDMLTLVFTRLILTVDCYLIQFGYYFGDGVLSGFYYLLTGTEFLLAGV